MLGPDYERPKVDAPEGYRLDGPDIAKANPEDGRSFGDLEWFEVFRDPNLRTLILEALDANYDLKIAVERILIFRGEVTRRHSLQLPTLNGFTDFTHRSFSNEEPGPFKGVDINAWNLLADLTWEFDIWGKFARGTEAARAELLAAEANRRAVVQTVVVQTATSYFTLMELDARLDIARKTLASREESLRLVKAREFRGVASMVDVRQSESLVVSAAVVIPETERLIAFEENALSVLLGRNPGAIPRSKFGEPGQLADAVPAGLPSELLERRPDLAFAEQQLVAANARIGAAKAELYPSISLTALGGFRSEELSNLFSSDALTWFVNPAIRVPIFNAGALAAGVDIAEASHRAALNAYMQAILHAFEEVSSSLVDLRKRREIVTEQSRLAVTTEDMRRLSNRRYEGGVTSYLEVLESERLYFDSHLALVRSQVNEQLALIALYRALGGGWKMEAKTADANGGASAPADNRATESAEDGVAARHGG
jgi:multidrug efflux system outer membrane protein